MGPRIPTAAWTKQHRRLLKSQATSVDFSMKFCTKIPQLVFVSSAQQRTGIDDAVDGHLILNGHVSNDRKHGDAGVDRREKADDVDDQRVSETTTKHVA